MYPETKKPDFPGARWGLNQGWGFRREKVSRAWLTGQQAGAAEGVFLPHSWNSRDTFQQDAFYYQGSAAYRRTLELPDDCRMADTSLHLVSGGFYGPADVWVDGRHCGLVDGQYVGMDLRIDHLLGRRDTHFISISLDNVYHPAVLPGKEDPDFLLHGGLAGGLFLERRALCHIERGTLLARCAKPMAAEPELETLCQVKNRGSVPHKLHCKWFLEEPDQAPRLFHESPARELPPNEQVTFHAKESIQGIKRWDLETASFYTVSCALYEGDRLLDLETRRIGIREARFDSKYGFFMNGHHVYLHGVNRHECMPGFGSALPALLHRHDAELLSDFGFNFVRLSHYPQSPEFLDACDELGILVYAELASWKSVRRGRWLKAARRQVEAMVRRDRHHPSIILWGLGNESRSRKAFLDLGGLARDLDPDRPTIYAENHLHRALRWRTAALTDVLGVNYELNRLDDAHEKSRHGAILVSEMSNKPHAARGDAAKERSQVDQFCDDLAMLKGKAFNAGYCLWCFNDYPTQRKQRFQRRPGVVDAWRIPKASAWYMRARNTTEPFIFAAVDWSRLSEEPERKLLVISNCTRIEAAHGNAAPAAFRGDIIFEYMLTFRDAPLVLRGENEHGSTSCTLKPYGKASGIELLFDQEGLGFQYQTGIIEVRVHDADGVTVTGWNENIHVSADGPGLIRYPFTTDEIEIRGGIGRMFVQSLGEHGAIELTAAHSALHTGKLAVHLASEKPACREL